MSLVMAIKPCNLVLKNMNKKESSNSSEASTPEEYLTPSGESVLLSDTSAFSFPDLDKDNQSIGPVYDVAKLTSNKNLVDENLNQSKAKFSYPITNRSNNISVDTSKMNNNNLNKQFEALERDIETKPMKLKTDNQTMPAKPTKEIAGDGELANIRKKLEERRRKMEVEKRRQEQQWSRQRQAISKEAYSALFGGNVEQASEFHLPSDNKKKSMWNGKDNEMQSSGYYRQDSAVAMEKLFANEESVDAQLSSRTLDRNFLKNQKVEPLGALQGNLTLDRKKTSSFREVSKNKNKDSEQRNSVDPNYRLSLDRLNLSLSELQGEIMRLSLQQDHIKNLVSLGDSPNHSASAPPRIANPIRSSSRQDPPVSARVDDESTRSRSGANHNFVDSKNHQPSRNSAFRRYSESRGQQPRHAEGRKDIERDHLAERAYRDDLEEQLLNHRGNIPYAHPAIIPAISPYPFLHPFHPPPYYPYMNPYFQPYAQPHYDPRSRPTMRNLEYRTRGEGQLKRDLSLGGMLDARSTSRRQDFPRRDSLSASRSSCAARDYGLARPSSVMSDYFSTSHVSSFDARPSLDHEAIYFQPRLARNPSFSGEEHRSPRRASQGFYIPDGGDDSDASAFPCDVDQIVDETDMEKSEAEQEEESKSIHEPEFFEVNLEAAKRPKPEIGLQRKSKAVKETVKTANSSFHPPQDAGEMDAGNSLSADVLTKSDDEKTETSSVGFIIEDTDIDPPSSEEAEKKKLRLAELHQRRKDELEAKKNIINKEQQAKKEQLRLKEEKVQKKKSDERQRRDLIFQKYLQRKAEMSETNSDEDSVKHFVANHHHQHQQSAKSSGKLRPPSQTTKKQRPQSQLVVGTSKEANSDFSDDCSLIITSVKQPLTAEPRIPSTPDGKKNEKLSRFLSCDGDKSEDASGLKLFVKPNQKSNRNIIINAIKDCCLAGVVNQDLKNKVLEEINRCESKHFVVLFRDAGLQYKGLYSYNPEKQEVLKIHGVGPKQLADKAMEKFFKYNSGSKNFSEVTSTKHLSSTIDGISILSCLWNRKQPVNTTPKRTT